jgi:hypothetical protein
MFGAVQVFVGRAQALPNRNSGLENLNSLAIKFWDMFKGAPAIGAYPPTPQDIAFVSFQIAGVF